MLGWASGPIRPVEEHPQLQSNRPWRMAARARLAFRALVFPAGTKPVLAPSKAG